MTHRYLIMYVLDTKELFQCDKLLGDLFPCLLLHDLFGFSSDRFGIYFFLLNMYGIHWFSVPLNGPFWHFKNTLWSSRFALHVLSCKSYIMLELSR